MPKVFISYCWSSPAHKTQVREWADLLLGDGVEVVLDEYDLKEGHDKYAFMERMVNDPTVTHVLVICDKKYTEKADARIAGVGTESQIISQEVYEKAEQSKFIPIVADFDEQGQPFLPVYLKNRIWIDFSTLEKVNENWEHLIRTLYGKPAFEKPKLGSTPLFITETSNNPTIHAVAKLNILKQAVLQGKNSVPIYRQEFLDSCLEYANELQKRERPNITSLPERILEDNKKLINLRNLVLEWVLLEGSIANLQDFSKMLIGLLEKFLELQSRSTEAQYWSDTWVEAAALFLYETFLYIVAALMKKERFEVLHEIFAYQYLLPENMRYSEDPFSNFKIFYAHSDKLQKVLAPEGKTLYSPAAELIKRNADRQEIPFKLIIEAELLVLLMACITPKGHWYPQTYHYSTYNRNFEFFLRASQHQGYNKLAIITGIADVNIFKEKFSEGWNRIGIGNSQVNIMMRPISIALNIENFDTK